jgi:Site-specific recombinase XerD
MGYGFCVSGVKIASFGVTVLFVREKEAFFMSRPKSTTPKPFLRQRKRAWQVRWTYMGDDYAMSIGEHSKAEAEITCAAIALALADKADWPFELIGISAVKRFLAVKAGNDANTDDKQLIDKYAAHMKTNSRSKWYISVKAHLKNAAEFTGNLLAAGPDVLSDYLNTIADTRTIATRNRNLASLSGFYRWARLKRFLPKGHDPLEGIQIMQEERISKGIIIWEPNEIMQLLKAADTLRDGIAIWIAIHAGLRRSEIARLLWTDVSPAYVNVRKSKTGIPRQVPLSTVLAERLKKEIRKGTRVVPWPEAFYGWDGAANRIVNERLPNHLKDIYKKHPEKFNWNPFRHTFASRHAQAGIPIDVIAAWLGDSPRICKEHYARYVPANMRDIRIDIVDTPAKKPKAKRKVKK